MEVHQHTQTPRKKWTHYFWEFLMLFLAVFCGFLAENQREHFIEHKRERQYIRSLVSDVATDTANINGIIKAFNIIPKTCDSVLDAFDEYSKHFIEQGERPLHGLLIRGFPDFIYTDRTMQQLKNAGGLRLIRNLTAADSIISYDAEVKRLLMALETMGNLFVTIRDFRIDNYRLRRLRELRRNNTDAEIEKMKISLWTSPDSKASDKLYNLILVGRNVVLHRIGMLGELKNKGKRLIQVLREEYQLE